MTIETFPRVAFPGYSDPDHPGGRESYLIRAKSGRRGYFYHILGNGTVTEHYSIEGETLTPHPLPTFTEPQGDYRPGSPAKSDRIEVKGIAS